MPLKEDGPKSRFTGKLGLTVDESEPAWPAPRRARRHGPASSPVETTTGEFPFTGTLERITVEVGREAFTRDAEAEMRVAMARQ
jgi:hypothetical protein